RRRDEVPAVFLLTLVVLSLSEEEDKKAWRKEDPYVLLLVPLV
ncbi:hypothetical protein CSUI_007196, partial [Cystoisospora suis]